jgi:hypothetical protein
MTKVKDMEFLRTISEDSSEMESNPCERFVHGHNWIRVNSHFIPYIPYIYISNYYVYIYIYVCIYIPYIPMAAASNHIGRVIIPVGSRHVVISLQQSLQFQLPRILLLLAGWAEVGELILICTLDVWMIVDVSDHQLYSPKLPSGKHTKSYWKWP